MRIAAHLYKLRLLRLPMLCSLRLLRSNQASTELAKQTCIPHAASDVMGNRARKFPYSRDLSIGEEPETALQIAAERRPRESRRGPRGGIGAYGETNADMPAQHVG